MKISVFGLGYIGLPTATMFAAHGAEVLGVDVNEYAVSTINQGKIHIIEPDLADLVKSVVAKGSLRASMEAEKADAFLIAVPTPFMGEHEADLSYIKAAVLAFAPVLEKGNIVILESTSPVGATETMLGWLTEKRPDLIFASENSDECDIYVAYCPERVLPGQVMHELIENDRIIGGINKKSAEMARDVYRIFVKGELLVTNARTAEMSKLTENAFRDVNIAFANELSLICDRLNINVWELIKLANHHPRVNILQPGPGVGGHCIAVDPWFIVSKTPDLAKLVNTARLINDGKPEWVKSRVRGAVLSLVKNGRDVKDIRIACLGLTFKPDIDDLRESPSLHITRDLADEFSGQVMSVEPNVTALPHDLEGIGVRLVDLKEAMTADVIVLLVRHKEFRAARPDILPSSQILIDTTGIWTHPQQC
ncbi:UDP-N-acetyl-D-mannosamine dehydrogenase [uncultured Desulfovibrio sp.]|uniref:UDP-N-acetyl-D-mannosamine dehydrogenase n=1 Tax=uncultured Desulfovibrio sp. TaxID=167968 RepID=UPI002583DEC5|nr:UDP-N-acetyl-D-mannosamine dehydrogenase [uncultured Desulfovibrio sp.]